jgi:hypothetical protein
MIVQKIVFRSQIKSMSEPRLWKWVTSREEETDVEEESDSLAVLYICQLVLLRMALLKATEAV